MTQIIAHMHTRSDTVRITLAWLVRALPYVIPRGIVIASDEDRATVARHASAPDVHRVAPLLHVTRAHPMFTPGVFTFL